MFLLFAIPLFLLGVMSFLRLNVQMQAVSHIMRQDSSRHYAAQRAMLAIKDSLVTLNKSRDKASMHDLEELAQLQGKFQGDAITFDILMKALALGSESNAFKEIDGGLTYQQWMLWKPDKRLPMDPPDEEIRKYAALAVAHGALSTQQGQMAIRSLQKRLYYQLRGEGAKAIQQALRARGAHSAAAEYAEEVDVILNDLIQATLESSKHSEATVVGLYQHQMIEAGGVGLIFFGIAIVLAWILGSFYLIEPLESVATQIQAMLDGKQVGTVVIRAQDEIGQLIGNFNLLTRQLSQTTVARDVLAQEVRERKIVEAALARQTEVLKATNAELKRFNRAAIGREFRIMKLKKKINGLCQAMGQAAPYKAVFAGGRGQKNLDEEETA